MYVSIRGGFGAIQCDSHSVYQKMPTVTPIVVFNATVSIKGIRLAEIPLTAYLEYYINIVKSTWIILYFHIVAVDARTVT